MFLQPRIPLPPKFGGATPRRQPHDFLLRFSPPHELLKRILKRQICNRVLRVIYFEVPLIKRSCGGIYSFVKFVEFGGVCAKSVVVNTILDLAFAPPGRLLSQSIFRQPLKIILPLPPNSRIRRCIRFPFVPISPDGAISSSWLS